MGFIAPIVAFVAANAGTIGTVVSAVSGIAGAFASHSDQTNVAQSQQIEQDAYNKRLKDDAIRQYGELDQVEADVIEKSHKESLQAQRDYLKARSQIELGAAVSGTYGSSVNIAIQDLKTGLGGRMADITSVRDSQLDEIETNAGRIQASVGANADYTPIEKPSFWKSASDGFDTFNSVSKITGSVFSTFSDAAPAVKAKPKLSINYGGR